MGQDGNIPELQRQLHRQLCGIDLPANDNTDVETQLQILEAACKGKRFLIVLDGL